MKKQNKAQKRTNLNQVGLTMLHSLNGDLKARKGAKTLEYMQFEGGNILVCKLLHGSKNEFVLEKLVFRGSGKDRVEKEITLQIKSNCDLESAVESYNSLGFEYKFKETALSKFGIAAYLKI